MAKPGSRDAARISAGGANYVDLSVASLSDEQIAGAQEVFEVENCLRCWGCGRRITIGIEFTSVALRDEQRPVIRMGACSREDCDFAERARPGATFMRMVEFAWLDELGKDAPAAQFVVARNERAAREAAAESTRE